MSKHFFSNVVKKMILYTLEMMNDIKESMQKEFDKIDLENMRFFLGIEVLQCSYGIYICQRKYTLEILRQFGMEECNVVYNPIVHDYKLCKDEVNDTQFKQMVGILVHITTTQLDLKFMVGLISRYMFQPT
ncbi:Copia protein, partial [Mucuna pruriens]